MSDRLRVQVSVENVDTGEWTEYDFGFVTEANVTDEPLYEWVHHPIEKPYVDLLRYTLHLQCTRDEDDLFYRMTNGRVNVDPDRH